MRPKKSCKISFCPPAGEYRPVGCKPCEGVELSREELEALRLKNVKGLDQTVAAEKMGISQSTFQRLLASAHRKVSEAIVYGLSISIDNKARSTKSETRNKS